MRVPVIAYMSVKSKSSALVNAGSVFAAILASFCCILPIVFALTGLSVIGASAAFAAWRPYLLTATFGLLAAVFYLSSPPTHPHRPPPPPSPTPPTNPPPHPLLSPP